MTRPEKTEDPKRPQSIDRADRLRLSGPGLKSFLAICDLYGVTDPDRPTLLGAPSEATYRDWVGRARADEPLPLPTDALSRISGLLGIHRALHDLFPVREEARTWLHGRHRGERFGGRSPLELMVSDGVDGVFEVRRYLEGWRGTLHEPGFALLSRSAAGRPDPSDIPSEPIDFPYPS